MIIARSSRCSPSWSGKVQAIKKIAPTRPHPSAPDTPPGNKLLGPATGLIDRLRDALSGRGKD
ncbi:MAG TPA: hypothetical protein VM347_36465 [Nonomuraea sp.]|nr:hypothetical protein [Nonomuraea sp.]